MHRFISSIDRFELETGTSLVVWLTPEGREKLSVESAYEISSECGCANVKWTSVRFGEQHIQHAPGGSEDQRVLEYYLENPEKAIDDIESKNEELEEEAEMNTFYQIEMSNADYKDEIRDEIYYTQEAAAEAVHWMQYDDGESYAVYGIEVSNIRIATVDGKQAALFDITKFDDNGTEIGKISTLEWIDLEYGLLTNVDCHSFFDDEYKALVIHADAVHGIVNKYRLRRWFINERRLSFFF